PAAHRRRGGGGPGDQPEHGAQGVPGVGARRPGRRAPRARDLRPAQPRPDLTARPGAPAPPADHLAARRARRRYDPGGHRGAVHRRAARLGPGGCRVHAAVQMSRVGRRYGRRWALRDCSLSLPEGRIIALVGPSGAGKTTLLNLVAGLLRPSEGTLRLFGGPVRDDPATLARIAYLAQDTALYPTFTVADLLTFGRRLNPNWDD